MIWILFSFTLICLALTLLPILRIDHWVVRTWDFPRSQVLAVCLLLIAGYGIYAWHSPLESYDETPIPWLGLFLCLLSTVYQLFWIIPFTFLYPVEVKSGLKTKGRARMRLLSCNVLQTNTQYETFQKLVAQENPDVIVTLESDIKWQEVLDQIEGYPYTVKVPQDNLYGLHVYSRLKLENSKVRFEIEDDIPSVQTDILLSDSSRVRAYFIHPTPPRTTQKAQSTERDAELVRYAKEIKDLRMPVVVAGDLNDVAWSATTRLFRKITGLLDPRVGRGLFNTFHAEHRFVRWPLDHIFHSEHFCVNEIRRLPKIGSDHFPMLIELAFTEEADRNNKNIADDPDMQLRHDEAEWAEEKD